MPSKTKNSPSSRAVILKRLGVVLSLIIVGYSGYIIGNIDNAHFYADLSKTDVKRSLHQASVELVYNSTKASAAGVSYDQANIKDFYNHYLTADLAAKTIQNGPATLFCADKSPDLMSFSVMNANANNDFLVHEEYFNGAGKTATQKNVVVEFVSANDTSLGANDKISKITCPQN